MAIGTANCTCATCGAIFTVRKKCYNRADADSFESWAAEAITECDACKSDRIQKEHLQESKAAAEQNAAAGLPTLIGTQKQIAWAESIRAKWVGYADALTAEADKEHEAYPVFVQAVNHYLGITDARWWINNRKFSEDDVYFQLMEKFRELDEG